MSSRARVILLLLIASSAGCSTFRLAEQSGTLAMQRHRQATDGILAIGEFRFESDEDNDTTLEASDLAQWQNVVVSALDQSNVFGEVVGFTGDVPDPRASYVLDGRITRFRFEKNWVPMFFPIHLGLSFLTFTGYTLFGGPITMTVVRFAVEFDLRSTETDETIASIERNYRSTRATNVYTKGVDNPYDNPNMVFSEILESAAIEIAASLPDSPDGRPNEQATITSIVESSEAAAPIEPASACSSGSAHCDSPSERADHADSTATAAEAVGSEGEGGLPPGPLATSDLD